MKIVSLMLDNLCKWCMVCILMVNWICYLQIGKDLLAHLMTVPKEEHIPLRQVMFALTIKAITAASFGLFFNDEKEVQKLHQGYDIVSNIQTSLFTGNSHVSILPLHRYW